METVARHSDSILERTPRHPGTGPGRSGVRRPTPAPHGARAVSPVRPVSRRRATLGVFAVLACMGIVLVTVFDPYAGAKASPYYRTPVQVPVGKVQKFEIDGGYVLVAAKRDGYRVVAAPRPKPVVPPAVGGGAVVAGGSVDGGSAAATTSYTTPSGVAQAYAAELVAQRGWGQGEFTCLVNLWNKESGWNTHAANLSSGAYGIPQSLPGSKMASFGADWRNDYRVQIQWGLSYVSGRYGSPCGAWGQSQAVGWY